MKIAIFEIEHFETAYGLIRLFDLPGNSVTVYTSEHIIIRFREFFKEDFDLYTWVTQRKEESHRAFIAGMDKSFGRDTPDILFYGAISNNHLLHAFLIGRYPGMRAILTVHDINSMFRFPFSLRPKRLIRYAGKKMLTRKAKEYNVIVETIAPYLIKHIGKKKKLHMVPGAVFEQAAPRLSLTGPIRIVIPGTIDWNRRNYEHVFEMLRLASDSHLPIEAILLGAPVEEYGKGIIARAKDWPPGGATIQYYESVISQPEFDRQMQNAHFVLVPSSREFISPYGVKETYGITKAAGSIGDIIRLARPFLIAQTLSVPGPLEESCFRYDEVADMIGFLRKIHQDPLQYKKWEDKALQSSLHYAIEKVRQRNPSLFAV